MIAEEQMRNGFWLVYKGMGAAAVLCIASTGCNDGPRIREASAEAPPRGLGHSTPDSLQVLKARADSLQAVLKKHFADSLKAVERHNEALRVERQRIEDSLMAERMRPRSLVVLQTTGTNVNAAKFSDFGFVIDSAGDCMLSGRIEALAGGNKDVQVLLMRDDEFVNWQNSPQGQAMALFSSPYQTVTTFDVPITIAGRFRIVVSNRISTFTQKSIKGSATVTCVGGVQPREL
jgi:hypothetical protein